MHKSFKILINFFLIITLSQYLHGAEQFKIIPDYKVKTLQKVIDKLCRAFPSNKLNPKLEMENIDSRVAGCGFNGTIYFEEKAYDICTSFGTDSLDAMASILSHELIHYYFGHHGSSINFITVNKAVTDSTYVLYTKTQEYDADLKGNLLAAMAGFNSLNIYDKVLERIYSKYWGTQKKIDGYPSLDERIEGAKQKSAEAKDLYLAFRLANNLMVVKEFDRALSYYEHIALSYGTTEIFNNIALCYLLRNGIANSIPYKFPFELDAETNLSKVKSRGDKNFEIDIQKAKEYLNKALNINEAYRPALINLACIAIIEGDENDAEYIIGKLRKKIAGNPPIIESLNGLLEAYVLKDSVKALQFFDEAIAKNDFLAQYNKDILLEIEKKEVKNFVDVSLEKVGGVDLDNFSDYPKYKKIGENFIMDTIYKNSHLIIDYVKIAPPRSETEKGRRLYFFNEITTKTSSTYLRVKIGDSIKTIIKKYGDEYDVFYSGQNQLISYLIKPNVDREKALIFKINDGIVISWIEYLLEPVN